MRVHHAVCDGLAALNTLLAATTDVPGQRGADLRPPSPASLLRRQSCGGAPGARCPRSSSGLPGLVRARLDSRRGTADFDGWDAVPVGLGAVRSSFNQPRWGCPGLRLGRAGPRRPQARGPGHRRHGQRRAARGDRGRDARGVRRARRLAVRSGRRHLRSRLRHLLDATLGQRDRARERLSAGRPGRPRGPAAGHRAQLPAGGRAPPAARVRLHRPGVHLPSAAGAGAAGGLRARRTTGRQQHHHGQRGGPAAAALVRRRRGRRLDLLRGRRGARRRQPDGVLL